MNCRDDALFHSSCNFRNHLDGVYNDQIKHIGKTRLRKHKTRPPTLEGCVVCPQCEHRVGCATFQRIDGITEYFFDKSERINHRIDCPLLRFAEIPLRRHEVVDTPGIKLLLKQAHDDLVDIHFNDWKGVDFETVMRGLLHQANHFLEIHQDEVIQFNNVLNDLIDDGQDPEVEIRNRIALAELLGLFVIRLS